MRPFKVIERGYDPRRLFIHPAALPAHRAWSAAITLADRFPAHRLLGREALREALRQAPLPVLWLPGASHGGAYGVIGRFNIYHQVTLARPELVTLAVIEGGDGWSEGRVRALSQAVHLLDIGGRANPLAEFSAVHAAAREEGWDALFGPRPARKAMAERLGTTVDRLRDRRARKFPGTP